MIKSQNIICFSSIDWGYSRHRHHHLMKRLARDNRVLFIENLGLRTPAPRDAKRLVKKLRRLAQSVTKGPARVDENLYIYSPPVLPFYSNWVVHLINRLWLRYVLGRCFRKLALIDPVVWVYGPTRLVVEQALPIESKLLVYDCCDNFPAFPHAPKDATETEAKMIKEADVVLASSDGLFEKVKALNSESYLIKNAAEVNHFAQARNNLPLPKDLKNVPRPIIGFIGAIYEWVDQDLICEIAKQKPDWSVVMIGPSKVDLSKLKAVPNVYLLGSKDYSRLPNYLKAFDVCTIPFLVTQVTANADQVKIYEYLSGGKPVVSTPLPEVTHFNSVVYVAGTSSEFIQQVQNGLDERNNAELAKLRAEFVKNETWDARFQSASRVLSQKLR